MKKFVFLYVGLGPDTPAEDMQQVWGKWFESVGDKFVDSGNPFGPGKEVTKTASTDLPMDKDAITGYSIVNAESLEAAEAIAKTAPIASVRVYEAAAM